MLLKSCTELPVNTHISTYIIVAETDDADDWKQKAGMKYRPVPGGGHYILLWYVAEREAGEYVGNENVLTFYCVAFLRGYFAQYALAEQMPEIPFGQGVETDYNIICSAKAKMIVATLMQREAMPRFSDVLKRVILAEELLSGAMASIAAPFMPCSVPACRFLGNDREREKIEQAIAIINAEPEAKCSITDLAKRVAINECYLKKGFKALTGKSINEYRQAKKIEKAQWLLQQQKTVTEVAYLLGYSSLAHFSNAYKKITQKKPCEWIK